MKPKIKYDPEVLRKQVKEELGVDLSNYINEDALSGLVDMLVIPKYVFKVVVTVVALFFGMYILGLTEIPVFTIPWVLFLTLGFIFSIFNIITVSAFGVLVNVKYDVMRVIDYIMNMFVNISGDCKNLYTKTREDRLKASGLLFKGIILVIINPTLCGLLEKKIPYISKAVTLPLLYVLNGTVTKFEVSVNSTSTEELEESEELDSVWTYLLARKIKTYSNKTFNAILSPFAILSLITITMLFVLIQGVL